MALSTTVPTWLSLDDWAKIMGYNRWHFNGIELPSYAAGMGCGAVWAQEPEDPSIVSREELALAIRSAEIAIADHVGFNLVPDWNMERIRTSEFPFWSNHNRYNKPRTLELKRKHLVSTGLKVTEAVELGASIVRVDKDGDGFDETARVTFAAEPAAGTLCSYKIFYPGKGGARQWEIKPVEKTDTYVDIPMWALVTEANYYNNSELPLNGEDDSIYVTTVDIYMVYNNPTGAVTLYYETDATNDGSSNTCTVTGRVHDHELSYIAYNVVGRAEPNLVHVNYYSGWQDEQQSGCFNELNAIWKKPVAYLAAGLLTQKPCACCAARGDVEVIKWMSNLDETVTDTSVGNTVTPFATIKIVENIFGVATRGAWYAYQMVNRLRVI